MRSLSFGVFVLQILDLILGDVLVFLLHIILVAFNGALLNDLGQCLAFNPLHKGNLGEMARWEVGLDHALHQVSQYIRRNGVELYAVADPGFGAGIGALRGPGRELHAGNLLGVHRHAGEGDERGPALQFP
jgi:hypothetical protein